MTWWLVDSDERQQSTAEKGGGMALDHAKVAELLRELELGTVTSLRIPDSVEAIAAARRLWEGAPKLVDQLRETAERAIKPRADLAAWAADTLEGLYAEAEQLLIVRREP